ncbi:MAG: phosphoethanolamine transferase, partial [Burkholderiaceae bacterium]
AAGALLAVFQDISSLMRNRRELRYLIVPANVVWSASRVLVTDARSGVAQRDPPEPAVRAIAAQRKPTLLVFVVGETARAANFSLNGYPRQTNPELAQLAVVNFPRTTACGTSTEVSLPCMFSPFGRADYDEDRIRRHESLLHLLARAGLRVVWLDNQSGCKGVCDGLEVRDLSREKRHDVCDAERCLDEILLHGLRDVVERGTGDTVVVLHQLGNHGPAYFRRYPPAMKRFEPACERKELADCTREQIVNAYDNAILYTDHLLARAIRYLDGLHDRYDVALAYVSDHGESLGERGLYLHGMPYPVAPREQLEVPMIWWFAPDSARNLDVDLACLRRRAAEPASHDHLFHSVLGLLAVTTPRYRPQLDLFGACRPTRVAGVAPAG